MIILCYLNLVYIVKFFTFNESYNKDHYYYRLCGLTHCKLF